MANEPNRVASPVEDSAASSMLHRIHRRHEVWAIVAVVLSVIAHVILAIFFPQLSLYQKLREPMREHLPPLRVEEVRTAPSAPASRPARFRPENPNVGGTVPEDAVAFRRSTDEGAMEPRSLNGSFLVGDKEALREPVALPERKAVESRQDILTIDRRVVADDVSALPRRFVASVTRSGHGGDIKPPAESREIGRVGGGQSEFPYGPELAEVGIAQPMVGGLDIASNPPPVKLAPVEEPIRAQVEEQPQQVTKFKPLEKLLRIEVQTCTDSSYGYCRIEIKRLGPEILPVLPKDMLFVQDCSASITEQKLHFCREGLIRALARLGAHDRFNVIGFRDVVDRCFPDWVAVTPENLARAREFIGAMRSVGDTDIYGSLRQLLDFGKIAGHPVEMLVISDGVATAGLTDRSEIIESFSQANKGGISVFTEGTYPGANAYLLDLLSYRNRGDTHIVRTGRWDIPDVTDHRTEEISRPVLSDLQFRFAGQNECEAYPALTSNLYLDRPLVLYARYPRRVGRLVFQVVGQAGETPCDMIFQVDLTMMPTADKALRTQWAWQKVYDLIGRYTETKDPTVLQELKQIGRAYGIRIPFRNELTQ